MNWNRFLLLVEPPKFGFWKRKMTFFPFFSFFCFPFRSIYTMKHRWMNNFSSSCETRDHLVEMRKKKTKNGINQSKNTLAKGNTNLINVSLFLSSVHKQFIRFKVMRFQVLHIFPFQRSADYKMCSLVFHCVHLVFSLVKETFNDVRTSK